MDLDLQKGWQQLDRWIRKERLGRRAYVQVNVLAGLIGFTIILMPFLLFQFLPDFNSDFLTLPIAAVGIAVAIIMVLIFSATSAARLRDMGRSPNWVVIGFLPYVNVLFFIILALTEGKIAKDRAGSNRKEESHREAP